VVVAAPLPVAAAAGLAGDGAEPVTIEYLKHIVLRFLHGNPAEVRVACVFLQ
jgi:hypothetical protein